MDIIEDDRIRLLDIADSIREISAYIGDTSYEEFLQEEDLMMAVTSQLLQIGGAASELSDEFKEKHGEVDWDVLRGLQYANYDKELELDLHGMWHIINTDLGEIMQKVSDLSLLLEKQELADDEGIDITELEEPLDFFGKRKYREPDTDEEVWLEISRKSNKAIVHMTSEQIDRLDVEDDSYINQRFSDEELFKNSSIDLDEDKINIKD
jgi:uncharacterized protein with HEPN domain